MKTFWKKNEETPKHDEVKWQYKLYITSDDTNGQLVESLAPLNWAEFLNRKIYSSENEENLVKYLVPNQYYIIGKRLVKFLHELPHIKVVVCELAKLTPTVQPIPHLVKAKVDEIRSLDEKINEQKEKLKQIEIGEPKEGKIYV